MARERQTIPGRDGQTDRKNKIKTLPTKKNQATISTGKAKPPEDAKKTAIVSNKQKKKSLHSSDFNTASEDEASDHSSDGEVYNKREQPSSADPSDDDKTDNNASGSHAGGKSLFFYV